jgi:hypothetical protein
MIELAQDPMLPGVTGHAFDGEVDAVLVIALGSTIIVEQGRIV